MEPVQTEKLCWGFLRRIGGIHHGCFKTCGDKSIQHLLRHLNINKNHSLWMRNIFLQPLNDTLLINTRTVMSVSSGKILVPFSWFKKIKKGMTISVLGSRASSSGLFCDLYQGDELDDNLERTKLDNYLSTRGKTSHNGPQKKRDGVSSRWPRLSTHATYSGGARSRNKHKTWQLTAWNKGKW